MKHLHITNGDSTANMLAEIDSIKGDILPWRDVLHDGPLHSEIVSHAKLRTQFLFNTMKQLGESISEQQIAADFAHRQKVMAGLKRYTEVTLWFEHDLYDQLQIIEVLSQLAQAKLANVRLTLVCIGDHPEVPYFYGLGNLTLNQLEQLYPERVVITEQLLDFATIAWRLITDSDYQRLMGLSELVPTELPFMKAALVRFFQEFPWLSHGLTLTQWHLMDAIANPLNELPSLYHSLNWMEQSSQLKAGDTADTVYQRVLNSSGFSRLFNQIQHVELAPFMGDLWIKKELDLLMSGNVPMIDCEIQDRSNPMALSNNFVLTDNGKSVLTGNTHWAKLNDLNLWRGGIHITSESPVYWCPITEKLC